MLMGRQSGAVVSTVSSQSEGPRFDPRIGGESFQSVCSPCVISKIFFWFAYFQINWRKNTYFNKTIPTIASESWFLFVLELDC